jgi:hypothetical protein
MNLFFSIHMAGAWCEHQRAQMASAIREAGTLGLNGIFYAASAVGSTVLTVAVGAPVPCPFRPAPLFSRSFAAAVLSLFCTLTLCFAEGSKIVGTIAKDVVITVVDKTAGETSKPAVFVRGSLEATGAVAGMMLDAANTGVRGAGQAGTVVAATVISTVGGVATDAVVATGTAVTKAVFDTTGTIAGKASDIISKAP